MLWRWFILLAAFRMATLITSEPDNTNSSLSSDGQDTRIFALQCKLNEPNCSCSMEPAGPYPDLGLAPCIWDASTCECGRDTGNTNVFVGTGPPVPAGKTCVVDTTNCKCKAGSLPLEPAATKPTMQAQFATIKDKMDAFEAELNVLYPPSTTSGSVGPSLRQKERLIDEVVTVITLLREVARKELSVHYLPGVEREALVARLREEIAYLTKMREDSSFMAVHPGKVEVVKERSVILRLRKIFNELEKASLKVFEAEEPKRKPKIV